MANVTKPFNNIHFLTEDQYRQETISENDIYAVQMLSITPGEIILKGFQNGIEVQLTDAQKAAARTWFGIPDSVIIRSDDPTVTEVRMVDAELMTVNTSMSSTPSDAAILTEKAVSDAIADKYTKPSSGIPKTDLASAVQTSLGKADSAYQKASTGIPKTDLASAVQTSLGKADSAYQKASTGIPKADLASAVQTSLGKADSAYQKASTGIPKADLASAVQTSLGKADAALQASKVAYETWTFTLDDESTVEKKVVLWIGN